MPSNPVQTAATLTAGLRITMADAYTQRFKGIASKLANVMDMGLPSDKRTETYAWYETAPYPIRWPRGENISAGTMGDTSFSVTNYKYGRRITWSLEDREDDQTRSLFDMARQLGVHFATLLERLWFQVYLGSTDPELLPTVPNAPDGAALFSATNGASGDRFGISGGNIITGTGVATAQAVRDDAFSAVQRMAQFQDTQGEPLWDTDVAEQGITVVYNVANDQVFREAFLQGRTLQVSPNAAAGGVGGGGVDNIWIVSRFPITLCPTQRITDNDWGVFMSGAPHKPIFQQDRRPLREFAINKTNSDFARDTDEEGVQWDLRQGIGVMLPYQCCQVNN
jgi:hypothetical protein